MSTGSETSSIRQGTKHYRTAMRRVYKSVDGEDVTESVCTSDGALELEEPTHHSQANDNNEGSSSVIQVPANVQRAQRLIYASHLVSQFSECAWQFSVVLFLAAVSDYNSILLVSSYYLTTYTAVMLLGAPIGTFLDRSNRLRAARLCIGIENGAVLLATIACCWLLTRTENGHQEEDQEPVIPHDTLSIVLMVAIHFLGSLAMLVNQGFVVAIERDWIVVLSQQTAEQEAWLSRTNVALRQIYLLCKVLSPTFAGWVVGVASSASKEKHRFCDLHNAAVMVGVLCVISLLVEYICTVRVYRLVPALALPQQQQQDPTDQGTDPSQEWHKEDDKKSIEAREAEGWRDESIDASATERTETTSVRRSFAIYWEQPIVWAGLSLAFVNSNALCFGGAMTTFLLWKGMPVEEVGLWRGLSSAVGLAGTFAYNLSTRHTTVVNTGGWSVVYLFMCLTLACSSFLIEDYHASVYLLVTSTAASRIGLWVFDISVTLLYQEMVPDGVRGLIGGTQQSINSLFTMASGCLGLFLHKPEQFFLIATAGYICIGISMLLYTVGVYRRGQQFFKPLNQQQLPEAVPEAS